MIERTCTAEIPVTELTTLITWLVLLDDSTQLLHTSQLSWLVLLDNSIQLLYPNHQDINCHILKQLSLLTDTIIEVTWLQITMHELLRHNIQTIFSGLINVQTQQTQFWVHCYKHSINMEIVVTVLCTHPQTAFKEYPIITIHVKKQGNWQVIIHDGRFLIKLNYHAPSLFQVVNNV